MSGAVCLIICERFLYFRLTDEQRADLEKSYAEKRKAKELGLEAENEVKYFIPCGFTRELPRVFYKSVNSTTMIFTLQLIL